ncbi:sugar ABC transporter substrate-binding protein [Agrococcus sp. KRD186]|uniref:sugar ABC transporter substrate-binding protein n=1 Tax=Agrococcus sp. KRD186 TaxID=2729730 RepID=UPI0019D0F968|nr:sugar ABC transporter substrate-binding protein [Agrococcus sp. KRD186]
MHGRTRRTAALIAAAASTALVLTGCSGAAGGSEGGGEGGDEDTIVIGQSLPTLDNPWYAAFADGAQDMADALGAELRLVTNPASSPYEPSSQIASIENLIAQRPDVIQIDPTSTDAINGAIDEARNQGIPVVTDGINVTTDVDASVVADNQQGGELAGEWVAAALPDGGTVAVLEGTPGRDIIQQRQDGFTAGLEANPGVEVVASQIANLSREEGQTVAENILQANPDLDAIWAANDSMALGALEALKSQGLAGQVLLGGFDGTPDAFTGIQDGVMGFTIDQVPYEMGATAIALAYLLATDGDAESEVILDTQLVDTENVGSYVDDVETARKTTLEAVLEQYGLTAE